LRTAPPPGEPFSTYLGLLYRLPESRRKRDLSDYLTQVIQEKMIILPYCSVAAGWFAAERARLNTLGQMPSYPDGQIAAIAKVNNLTLVTRNVSDYTNFEELTIKNWFV
jgi:tRNA(fMet)-specific endonuclease VapC